MFLLEDAAHRLSLTTSEGDAIVFSPRKLLPVGTCGVLVCSEELSAVLPPAGPTNPRVEILQWLAKRVMQKALVPMRFPWHRWRGEANGAAKRMMDDHTAAGRYSISLMELTLQRAEEIASQRRANYLALVKALQDVPGVRP